ncbi:MAG: hypothetical protein K2I18_05690 [Paramuribaculum sp.]|nr:hypothetical protein [Paramuribaculum sp.]
MNFTLTPGVYAALNLLSKATRSKVLEAAFAFVICGIRPANLSKNLLVMFMMVVDSASEGKLTYTPDQPAEKTTTEDKPAEEPAPKEGKQPEEPAPAKAPENKKPEGVKLPYHTPGSTSLLRDYEMALTPGFTKVKGLRRRVRNRGANANNLSK